MPKRLPSPQPGATGGMSCNVSRGEQPQRLTQSQFTQSNKTQPHHAHPHQTQSPPQHFLGCGWQSRSAAHEAGQERVKGGGIETWFCQWGGRLRAAGWAVYPGFSNTSWTQGNASTEDEDPAAVSVPTPVVDIRDRQDGGGSLQDAAAIS
jgi:hypothetical protein